MDYDVSSTRLLTVPYDSGAFGKRMGAGPLVVAEAAVERLRAAGHDTSQQQIDPQTEWRAEIQTAFELQRLLAREVGVAVDAGLLPLVLSGNCMAAVGALAGSTARGRRMGLLWLDSHADFNTPETTESGFLDGQCLSMIVGRCWTKAMGGVPGFTPLPEGDVLLVGAHELDRSEEEMVRHSEINWLPPDSARGIEQMTEAVTGLGTRVDAVHVHIDLDVLDSERVAPANPFAVPGGLTVSELHDVIERCARRIPIASATLASFDPECDTRGRMRQIVVDLLALLSDVASPAPAQKSG